MRTRTIAAFVVVTAASSGCLEPGTNCTLEARASVTVTVENNAGEPIDDATVTFATDGGALTACDTVDGNSWSCGFEVEGEIEVEVKAAGFVDQTQTFTIEKTDDGCHVDGEAVTFTMAPLPPA